jgi:hypothetical protein
MKLPYIEPEVELFYLSTEQNICSVSGTNSGEDMGIGDPLNPFSAPMFDNFDLL